MILLVINFGDLNLVISDDLRIYGSQYLNKKLTQIYHNNFVDGEHAPMGDRTYTHDAISAHTMP